MASDSIPVKRFPPVLTETAQYDHFWRKTSMKSTPASPCQHGGRRFAAELRSASARRAKPASEPGLVLQETQRPGRSRDRAFLVRVMDGGLLGPLPPPAHPQQRHQAAQPRGQQQPARGFGEQHDVGSPDRGHGEVGEGPTSPWVSVM